MINFLALLSLFSIWPRMAAGATGYTYYKWTITNTKRNANDMVQAAEFKEEGGGTGFPQNLRERNPLNEQVQNLVDGNFTTKWLDFEILSNRQSTVIFKFNTAQALDDSKRCSRT